MTAGCLKTLFPTQLRHIALEIGDLSLGRKRGDQLIELLFGQHCHRILRAFGQQGGLELLVDELVDEWADDGNRFPKGPSQVKEEALGVADLFILRHGDTTVVPRARAGRVAGGGLGRAETGIGNDTLNPLTIRPLGPSHSSAPI